VQTAPHLRAIDGETVDPDAMQRLGFLPRGESLMRLQAANVLGDALGW
jgi:hypothetical protein